MKLIIEDYTYRLKADKPNMAMEILQPLELEHDGCISISKVGYYFNQKIHDTVFFLPKVVLNKNGKLLGKYSPDELVDLSEARQKGVINDDDYFFIYGLSVWIYRAISVYKESHDKQTIIFNRDSVNVDCNGEKVYNTFLDIILSLQKFNRENQDFFIFMVKNMHSGYNRINWTKTVSKSQVFFDLKGIPVYLNMVNKKKQINFDEELLIIFFSILKHIHDKYGFPVNINFGYELLTENQMETYLEGYGMIRLEQIRYKYFSDKLLLLWQLCYDFFAMSNEVSSNDTLTDYLLVQNFNIVFEAMIDKLLSEQDDMVDKLHLKEQNDGKIVDHIYRYQGFIHDERDIFYIGDSKYYKLGSEIGKESIYKQYTYARNVIQANLDVFNSERPKVEGKDYLEYRDDITEGYNITPNFFIRSHIPFEDAKGKLREPTYNEDDLTFLEFEKPNFHFKNRLFDRDTLLLQHYSVNFLFVLALYGSNDEFGQKQFRDKARKLFRNKIIDEIEHQYKFFSLQVRDQNKSLEEIIDGKYFRKLLGKAFRPYSNKEFIYLSLDNAAKYRNANMQLLSELSADFTIRQYRLGTDPRNELEEFNANVLRARTIADGTFTGVSRSQFSEFKNDIFVIGGYRKDKGHLDWIKRNYAYNVRLGVDRNGYVTLDMTTMSAQFLVLYSIADQTLVPKVYKITNKSIKSQDEMQELGYPSPSGNYLLYHLEELEYKFERLDLQKLFSHAIIEREETKGEPAGSDAVKYTKIKSEDGCWDGSPLYYTGEQLHNFILEI